MGFYRVIRIITVIAFMLEVVNPSTTFVREHKPISRQKLSKIEKKAQEQSKTDQTDDTIPESNDDDDYLACSAVLPSLPAQPKPLSSEQSLFPLTYGSPREFVSNIHRPPSLS